MKAVWTGEWPKPKSKSRVAQAHLSSSQIQDLIAGHHGIFSQFREVTDPIFEVMLEGGKKFSRRPNVGLRLMGQIEPPVWVLVRPGWDRYRKEIRPIMVAETVAERIATSGIDCKKPLPHVEVAVEISDKGPRWTLWTHHEGEAALDLMVETMADFILDPEGVFARSADRCCLCGRALTDEVSRGRGIGPECLQKYHSAHSTAKR